MAAWSIRRSRRDREGPRLHALEGVLLALGAFFFLGTGLRQASIAVDPGPAGAIDSLIGPLALAAQPIALAPASLALRAGSRVRTQHARKEP